MRAIDNARQRILAILAHGWKMPKGKVTTVGKAALCWGLLTSPCHVHGQETPSAALALYRQLRSVGISAATTHQKRNTPAATMYRSTRSVFVSTHST